MHCCCGYAALAALELNAATELAIPNSTIIAIVSVNININTFIWDENRARGLNFSAR